MFDILTRTLGLVGEVKKSRVLYRIGQTRVHLGQVERLGDYLELEVVLRPDQTEADGQKIAEKLLRGLGIRNEDYIGQAYVDLLGRLPATVPPDRLLH